jgi:hypothetical protein
MHVWYVNTVDAIPGENFGYTRGIDFARALVSDGHTVSWFAFGSHFKKERWHGDAVRREVVPYWGRDARSLVAESTPSLSINQATA